MPYGMALPSSLVMESWTLGRPRRAPGLIFPAAVLELADEFLLLRIDRDHRLTGSDMLADTPVEVAELGVAILVLTALQAEPHRLQRLRHLRSETG